ncbi:MAG: transglutaminase family protein, partial [Planctomycetota bacterium]
MSIVLDKFIGFSSLLIYLSIATFPVTFIRSAPAEPVSIVDDAPLYSENTIDWTKNIAHIALDVEKMLHDDYVLIDLERGIVTMKDNHALLDRIFAEAEDRICVRSSYTEQQALDVVKTIYRILEEEGFRYRDYSSDGYFFLGCHLFGYGLAKREIDCVSYSLLGLGVAERLNLPMTGIFMPGHFALRWHLDHGESMNIEMTVPARCDNDFYIGWKGILRDTVERGVYLRDLSRREVVAQQFYSLSLVWER